ncbi:4-hydroxy-3-methylbut-2-enyl diphosphate reductase [Jiulongibacter sediminis]|uniref:4-hydroxy-3-methylbut-2-enyl diphosphate reductase n=1 Tax=Jiulongibacter sediminis TaxID=1605367 RepID=A0A0P7C3H1_9BACT|nr:4-hydroxy-3-methylbut-2-enyl diphosphate reductase [Jiulongibacter sediminis]KPM48853.1 4-hydroxy-3-methylbut-2-enyl diphosphate reductase [Jiulongibacter sediminis]TBX25383.1 4-hydroxy-3-methylbut-2-enyl diphosphate reductase [Jiulongibacter sediminis]
MKKFNIPEFYRSPIIGGIKEHRRSLDKLKKDFSPTILDFGDSTIHLARHFGFCYGVENAVEIAYQTLDENPDKRVFLLSEMIHNPEVNADLLSRGVKFLMDTSGNDLIDWTKLKPGDIVIVPAFGTTLEIQEKLNKIGIDPYKFDTTCPFVEKVWNRAAQIGERGYTIIVHGKPKHEETRATFSHSKEKTPTLVLKNIEEAQKLSKFIKGESSKELFFEEFKNQFSEGFDPELHLKRIGVVNQTTMLASETQEISDYLKSVIQQHYQLNEDDLQTHFANTRDTLCYATNDNQEATYELLKTDADLAIVVGGYNSSNTSHLVELCEQKLPTYFIRSAESLISGQTIKHFDLHKKEEITTHNYLKPQKKLNILLTCGASCPDAIMEGVLVKLHSFFQNNVSIKGVIEGMNIEISHID